MALWAPVLRSMVLLTGVQVSLVAFAAAVSRANIYRIVAVTVCVSAPAVFFADRVLTGQTLSITGRVFLVLFHLGLGGLFFHFMTLPDRSVTLRLLVELQESPSGALSIDEINVRYGISEMIGARLVQLAAARFLTIDSSGDIALAPRGTVLARFIAAARRLCRIESAN
jgi:hypothetical protein